MADLSGVIARHGRTFTVKRHAAGAYVNGRWVQGAQSQFTVTAVFQPMDGRELQRLPAGERTREAQVGWCATELRTKSGQVTADIVVIDGEDFEVEKSKRRKEDGGFWRVVALKISR